MYVLKKLKILISCNQKYNIERKKKKKIIFE